MQENQTLINDVSTGTSPSANPQQPDLPHFLKSKKAKVIGLTILVIFSLLLTSTIALNKLRQDKQPSPSTTPSTSQTPNGDLANLSRDEALRDWETYRDERLGFELKHPSTWYVDETKSGTVGIIEYSEDPFYWQGKLTITIDENPQSLGLEKWIEVNRLNINPLGEGSSQLIEVADDNILDDLPATKLLIPGFDNETTDIVSLHNNKVYSLSYEGGINDPNDAKHKEIYNQILSTFEFLTPGEINKEMQCIEYGGEWLEDFNECEGITKRQCLELGGLHNNCASPCRHQPKADMCIDLCVNVCKLN